MLDCSNVPNLILSSMSVRLSDFMRQNGLVDPWRARNPSTKKFPFFSPQVHHSYSRIDYFFIDQTLNSFTVSADSLGIVISDMPLYY